MVTQGRLQTQSIHYKLGVTVHCCLQYKSPEYLVDFCTPVSDIPSRRHLQSATRHHLTIPRHWLSTFGRRAFSVAGPTAQNSLPDSLRDAVLSSYSFRQPLNRNLFGRCHSAHRAQQRCFMTLHYINLLLTLTLAAWLRRHYSRLPYIEQFCLVVTRIGVTQLNKWDILVQFCLLTVVRKTHTRPAELYNLGKWKLIDIDTCIHCIEQILQYNRQFIANLL